MKTTALLLSLVGASSGTSAPEISVGVRDGNFDLSGLQPTLKWETAASAGEYEFEGGIDATIKPVEESIPYTIWGKVGRKFFGWSVSARADVDSEHFESVNFDVRAGNEDADTSVKMVGSVGENSFLSKIEAKTAFDAPGGRFSLNPRYNCKSVEGDAILSYDFNKTSVDLTASLENQKLTISRVFGGNTRVAPSLSASGDFDLEIERMLEGSDSVTATFKPKDSVKVKWVDGPWIADINAPLNGWEVDRVDVSVKRKVDVF